VPVKQIPDEIKQRKVTNSTLHSLRELGLLDKPEGNLEKLAEANL